MPIFEQHILATPPMVGALRAAGAVIGCVRDQGKITAMAGTHALIAILVHITEVEAIGAPQSALQRSELFSRGGL